MAASDSNVADKFKMLEQYSFEYVLKNGSEDLKSDKFGSSPNLPTSDNQILNEEEWKVESLSNLREILNQCKSQIDQIPLQKWNSHTNFTEVSSKIKKEILSRLKIHPPILTRAWIKFYDILNNFEDLLFPVLRGKIRVMFLCEAPGAFINATNHFVKTRFGPEIKFEWAANSLNPYYEHINVRCSLLFDEFISQTNTYSKWFFGSSNTGNVLASNFADDLVQWLPFGADDDKLFDLVTGDGSVDCIDCFDRQEEEVFPLIHAEAMVAMRFLRPGGGMVIKFFTFFHCRTISLLYYLSLCFDRITCYKPVASKHGNSEIYLVFHNFDRARYLSFVSHIGTAAQDPSRFIWNRDQIPDRFITAIVDVAEMLAKRQMERIDNNVKLFQNPMDFKEKNSLRKLQQELARAFVQHSALYSLPVNEQLMISYISPREINKRFSYHLKKYFLSNPHYEFGGVARIIRNLSVNHHPDWYTSNDRGLPIPRAITPVHGDRFEVINNCRFVCQFIMRSFTVIIPAKTNQSLPPPLNPEPRFTPFLYELIKEHSLGHLATETPFLVAVKQFFAKRRRQRQPLTRIHFIDLYDLMECPTDNDYEQCDQLRKQFGALCLKQGDTVMIRFQAVLSRLSVGLVYLLTRAFNHYVTLWCEPPRISGWFLQLNSYRGFFPINPTANQESLFNLEHPPQWWNPRLLEIISVPDMLTDIMFYNSIYYPNCFALLSYMKRRLSMVENNDDDDDDDDCDSNSKNGSV